MKCLFFIIFLLFSCSLFAQNITGMEDMFGTTSNPVALDTLTNTDSTQTRTILFGKPYYMGGSVSVSGYIKNLTVDTVNVVPKYARVYAKYSTRLGPFHTLSTITISSGSDSVLYELNISGDSNWQFGWGYALRYVVSSGTHTTKIESVGSHR